MKKSFRIIAGAFAIVALASCTKENQTETPSLPVDGKTVAFELTVSANEQTKASFSSSARQLAWQEGDQVAVFDGTAKQIFTVVASTINGGSARFNGQITAGAENIYVAYPADAAVSASAEGIAVTIPSVQTVPSGENSDPNAFVMVGKADAEGDVALKNVVSLVKCSFAEAATSVTIACEANISGDVTANPLSGVSGAASAKTVTATGAFAAGSSVYVAVAPATVEGFRVMVRNESGRTLKSTAKTAEFKRNGILSIGNVDEGAVAFPAEIKTYEDYVSFAGSASYYTAVDTVALAADIDMTGKEVAPVAAFSGVFNGGNHTLSNVTIVNTESAPAGLFSELSGATVMDLKLENINVSSTYVEVGAVAGHAEGTTFKNITVTGGEDSIISTTANFAPTPTNKYGSLYANTYAVAGGIVGSATGGVIDGCSFGGKVSSDSRCLGGIVGFVGSAAITIKNCSFTAEGSVNAAKATQAAGIVAISISSDLKVDNCQCLGNVSAGYSYVAGIAGTVTGATFTNCSATGATIKETATGSGCVAGIVSYADGGTLKIENCTADGCTFSGGFGIGGILGHAGDKTNTNIEIKNCHAKNECSIKALHTSAYSGGLVGRANTKVQKLDIVDSDVTGCTLLSNTGGQVGGIVGCNQAVASTLTRVVSDGNSLRSDNAAAYCGGIIGCHYGANVTISDSRSENLTIDIPVSANSNSSFVIGRATNTCTKVSIVGHTVKNSTLTTLKGQTNGGFMGYLDAANLEVKNSVADGITLDCVRRYAGGVVGNIVNTVKTVVVDGFTLSNSTIKITGNVDGENQNYTGGVVGYMSGSVTEVTVKNTVVSNTKINCNRSYVGGIFGTSSAKSAVMENCVVGSGCEVKGSYSIGGITGGAFFGNGSKMSIDKCFCYGNVTSNSNQVGGLVGLVNNNALTTPAVISVTNSAYIGGTISTTHAGNAKIGGIIGCSGGFATEGENNRAKIYIVNCASRPGQVNATKATPLAETSEAYVGGFAGHIHSGTKVYGCYSGAAASQIASNGLNSYPVWGILEDVTTWFNSVDKVYFGNGYASAGYLVNPADAQTVGTEALASLTDGALLTKLNEAAAAYNASPLLAGTSAESWVNGAGGYPVLASHIEDPDL